MPKEWEGPPPPRLNATKNWDELLSGGSWVFTEDVDFQCTPDNFRSQVYQHARRRGLRGCVSLYQIEPDEEGRARMWMQCTPPEDYVKPPVPIRPPSKQRQVASEGAPEGDADADQDGPQWSEVLRSWKERTGARL